MRGILLSLFLLLPLAVFSQESVFKGFIVEEGTTVTIGKAIVAIDGTTLATTADENGAFVFDGAIPAGEHIVTVSKEGFEDYFFGINVIPGKTILVDRIQLSLTSKEKKRRKKLNKSTRKEDKKLAKEREKKIKEAKKDKKAKDKRLAKQRKKLEKQKKKAAKRGDVVVIYDDLPDVTPTTTTTPAVLEPKEGVNVIIAENTASKRDFSELQRKYARALGISASEITNVKLYEFIDEWMGTPYVMGGSTKEGIDCSSFSQLLFTTVYDQYIERTAETQYDSHNTDLFRFINDLQEGDLVFFYGSGAESGVVNHVGVYLGNKKFINATSTKGKSGTTGVKISDLSDSYWIDKFCCGGARIKND